MGADPVSLKKMPSDDVPRRMLTLVLEMLKSGELADDNVLLIGGACNSVLNLTAGRPSLAQTALGCGVSELVVAQLNALGSPANWVTLSRSRGKAGIAGQVAACTVNVFRCFAGQAARPDLAACVSSGLFDLSIEAVVAFAAAGVDGLGDTDHMLVTNALSALRSCRGELGCEAKIRGVAPGQAPL